MAANLYARYKRIVSKIVRPARLVDGLDFGQMVGGKWQINTVFNLLLDISVSIKVCID